ncbi:MAG: nitronate monooxygenase [Candidatus Nanopelagicales bacterium]
MKFPQVSTLVSPISNRTPIVIQGGMGVAVSSYELAKAVSQAGELGVVSGTGLDQVIARRLQSGDETGDVRRALKEFPDQRIAADIVKKYFREKGRNENPTFRPTAKLSLEPNLATWELVIASAFVETWLAKENHTGLVGINLLEKIQLSTLGTLYGAMLAGVDAVLMGAGIPTEIPRVLNHLSKHEASSLNIDVAGATIRYQMTLDPNNFEFKKNGPLHRPFFLAIVTNHVLAMYLSKDEATCPDGFVVERPDAGGHNAPPRGKVEYNQEGEPIYGPRDDVDYEKLRAVGLPFWMAGGYSTPEKVLEAHSVGACGVQVGSLFALSDESGILRHLKDQLLSNLLDAVLKVKTDAQASPTGFPFKVAGIHQTVAEDEVFRARPRLCDMGYLRTAFEREPGTLGYRCAAEPLDAYVSKGGDEDDALNRKCLCNGLMATVGIGQVRPDGFEEKPLLTLGSDLAGPSRMIEIHHKGWSAIQVLEFLLNFRSENVAAAASFAQSV